MVNYRAIILRLNERSLLCQSGAWHLETFLHLRGLVDVVKDLIADIDGVVQEGRLTQEGGVNGKRLLIAVREDIKFS